MYSKAFVCRLHRATKPKLHFILAACVAMWLAGVATAQTFTVLYAFQGPPDAKAPDSTLLLDSAGTLYGVSLGGGVSFEGAAFELTASGKETVLYNFLSGYGRGPNSVIQVPDATLYGTTTYGGSYGEGAVFKLDQKRNETVLYSFQGDAKGGGVNPNGVIRDEQGNLYGTTTLGGQSGGCFGYGCGMVFTLDPAGKFTVLYTFTGEQDGGYASGPMVQDAAGNLYGATGYGGDLSCFAPHGCGVVFKIDPSGKETVLHTFTGKNGDGAGPWSGVVSDSDGDLYGATLEGGTGPNCTSDNDGCGTVYKIDKSGSETILHSFTGKGADDPPVYASLTLDAKGNIYGTTPTGGGGSCSSGCGAIFMLDPAGKDTILYEFNGGTQGAGPQGGVTLDSAGNIYGTTGIGGDLSCGLENSGCGIVFKLTPKGK